VNNKIFFKAVAAIAFLIICGQTITAQKPRVFILNPQILLENKTKISNAKSSDSSLKSALAKLENDANKALKTEVLSIVTKQADPPSGDKHDYVSQAPYFWRNPKTPDGLPYIRKDGERNPEIKKYPDHDLMDKMTDTVEKLSIAFYFTNKEEYAAKAAEILRMWFLDAKTKMNPNLEYAQAIPGVNTGRGIGIIETRELTQVVDSIGLLEGSKSWTKDDQKGLETWFSNYLQWLTTSKNGIDESQAKNNHGTFYDVQIVAFALFVGKNDFAKSILETAKQKRIAKQIEPDGKQPLELERTKSWSYSTMNLEGFVTLAELGEKTSVDLWNFQTSDGRSIRKAIEFLQPFLSGDKKWTYDQIEPLEPAKLFPIMRRAARKYTDEKFMKMMLSVPKLETGDKDTLLFF
jgi:Alginate lyase